MRSIWTALADERLYRFALIAWCVNTVFALFFISPNTDDGYYLIPTLTTYQFGFPGTWVGDSLKPVFFMMPTFPFVNGLAAGLLTFLGIDLGPVTYRLFSFACIGSCLFFSLRIVDTIQKHRGCSSTPAKVILLAVLATTPFIRNCWIVRPEPFGLTVLLAAIYTFAKQPLRKLPQQHLALGCVLIGMSAIVHPVFFIGGALLGLTVVVKLALARLYKNVAIAALSAALPLSALGAWVIVNIDEAKGQLLQRAGEVKPQGMSGYLGGLKVIADNINIFGRSGSFTYAVYDATFYVPFLLVLIAGCYLFYTRAAKSLFHSEMLWAPATMLPTSLIVLATMAPFPPYFMDMSLFLGVFMSCFVSIDTGDRKASPLWLVIAGPLVVGACFVFMLFHSAKHVMLTDELFSAHETKRTVLPQLQPEDRVYTNGGRLMPSLASLQQERPEDFPKVNFVFLYPRDLPEIWHDDARRFLDQIESTPPQHQVWAFMKPTIYARNGDQSLCFRMKGFPYYVLVANGSVLHEDAGNVFYRSGRTIIARSQQTSCADLERRL